MDEQPVPEFVPIEHEYLSTACLHGAHEVCQVDTMRYDGTYKVAAVCKWCTAPCVCDCHQQES